MSILKNQAIAIDEEDDNNDVSESISDGFHVPIICLDDDDDDDDGDGDKEYVKFLDNLRDNGRLGPEFESNRSNLRYEVDNGVSDIRKFGMFSKTPLTRTQRDNRVIERRSEISRVPLVKIQEDIERDNRAVERRKRLTEKMAAWTSTAVLLRRTQEDKQRSINSVDEQRKRKFAETMAAAEASKDVPLVTTQEDVQRDNRVGEQRKRKFSEIKATGASREDPLVVTQEDVQRDNRDGEQRKRKFAETMAAETSRAVPVVTTQQDIQRDNSIGEQRKRKFAETMVAEASRDVPLVTTQENVERGNSIGEQRKMVFSETKTEALEDVPLVTTQEDIRRNNGIDECENRKLSRTKARGTARAVPVLRVSKVEWRNCSKNVEVNEVKTPKDVPVTRVNNGGAVGRKRKTEEESLVTADEDYMSYLKWLVKNLKAAVCEKQPSSSNKDAPKESTITPEMNLRPVKLELETESWSDSEVIVLGDSPFMNGEVTTPFVVSKSEKVIAIDESINAEDEDQSSQWFKEKLMDILERPYDEKELLQLSREVSIHKQRTRCRELRDGREHTYATDTLALSYLDMFPDFSREYKPIQRTDRHKALKLLRGFFFYLKNVVHEGAFKPWLTNNFN